MSINFMDFYTTPKNIVACFTDFERDFPTFGGQLFMYNDQCQLQWVLSFRSTSLYYSASKEHCLITMVLH